MRRIIYPLPHTHSDFNIDNAYNDELTVDLIYYNHRYPTPDWTIPQSIIDFTDVTYILGGEAEYSINDEVYPVSAGDLICIPHGSKRSAKTFPNRLIESQCLNIVVHTPKGTPFSLPFPLICRIGNHPDLSFLYDEIQKAVLLKKPGCRLHAQAYILLILEEFYQLLYTKKENRITDFRVRKIMEYVAVHYNQSLKLSDAARIVDLSPVYFGNLFKQQTGMSFRQYITTIRLNQAENMLLNGENTVGEVAELCGFSDAFYFSKVYREQKGISPSKVSRFHDNR